MATQLDAFQTLADPTRRRIVETLRHGEQQVNDLVAKGVQPPPPGRVEGWRGAPKAGPIYCSPFPLGVPQQPRREPVSNPRHVERSRRFSRTPLSCSLHLKAYVAYPLGSAFGGRLTR